MLARSGEMHADVIVVSNIVNAIFGKVGRTATEEVVLQRVSTKCLLIFIDLKFAILRRTISTHQTL
jgi:hypothetical protein